VALAICGGAVAQSPATPPLTVEARPPDGLRVDTYRLWPGRAPGAQSDAASETPTLTLFRPPPGRANGTAVVIAPGGGYTDLASSLEGAEPAAWFTARGVAAFVLTYRVGQTARLPIPLFDGARAIRFVRAHAAEFQIDPKRIGMMGFSAGGHLAAMTAVEGAPGDPTSADGIERVSSRPDFLILGYPWLEGTLPDAKGQSQYCSFAQSRAGPPCVSADYARFAPTAKVTAATPPTFIYHTTADDLVPVQGSLRFFEALVAHRVPAEFHAFEAGAHGSGLGGLSASLVLWPDLLQEWMRRRRLLIQN
jgi:acetyl esterase/lipase